MNKLKDLFIRNWVGTEVYDCALFEFYVFFTVWVQQVYLGV